MQDINTDSSPRAMEMDAERVIELALSGLPTTIVLDFLLESESQPSSILNYG
jgi:hypothetical protein